MSPKELGMKRRSARRKRGTPKRKEESQAKSGKELGKRHGEPKRIKAVTGNVIKEKKE